MTVAWTPEVVADRRAIYDYIEAENPRAAIEMDERFQAAAESLTDFPERGRPGLIRGTRELVLHPSYCLVYEIDGEAVWILALVHTARRWPPAPEG